METREYAAALRRAWWVVVLATIVGTLAGWGLSKAATPLYTSSAQVYVSLSQGNTAADLANGSNYTQQQVLSFAQLATAPVVLDPVIARLSLEMSSSQLAKNVTATTPLDTSILLISVTDASPTQAADIANQIAKKLGVIVEQVAPKNAAAKTTVTVTTIAPATPPSSPSSPKTGLNTMLGFVIGLFGSIAIILLWTRLDTRIRRRSDVTRVTDIPVLGSVAARRDSDASDSLVMVTDPVGPEAESYRQLRSDLQFVAVDSSSLAIVVTSSIPGEGKSTVTCNLALAMAETGSRVLIIDADLHRPAVARYLGLEGAAGLTTILVGRATFDDVVQPWGDSTLDVLTSGVIPPNPSEMMSSRTMATLLAELRKRYDVIIIDTAPALAISGPAIVTRLVDGALVVADSTRVRRPQLQRTLEGLTQAGAAVVGVSLNRVRLEKARYTYYGGSPVAHADQSAESATASVS